MSTAYRPMRKQQDQNRYLVDAVEMNDELIYYRKPIAGSITMEDDTYFIKNEALDIIVWGDSRAEAEEAFRFALYALHINYTKEADEYLSGKAIELKSILC